MNEYLLITVFLLAGLDWLSVFKDWKPLEYITKPGTMIALLIWMSMASRLFPFGTPPHQNTNLVWFIVGLLFSISGDIFLMLPNERFIPGLIAFLFAHIAYIIGLNQSFPPMNIVSLILIILILITVSRIHRNIDLQLSGSARSYLRIPILAYTVVISLMLLSALMTYVRPEWEALPALLVSVGALLFFISDTLIAWDRFVESLSNRDIKVMVTYHLGQIGLIVGSVIQFVR
ncbi:MAG: lysoplasmalogenase [Anaerolineales bacterium]|jgi:uncharacterized membrane protein YhhN